MSKVREIPRSLLKLGVSLYLVVFGTFFWMQAISERLYGPSMPKIRGVPKVFAVFNIRFMPSIEYVYLLTAKIKITGSNFQIH